MKRVLAIAMLTVRESVRSGAAAALLGLTLTLVGWLALTLQGDGTLAGQVRVFVRYATGVVAAVLGLATLWLAAGRISSEVDDKTVQTLAVKPVHPAEVWLGKWLGLVLMDAVLLAAAGTVVAVSAFLILNHAGDHNRGERDDARRHALVCRVPIASAPDPASSHKAADCEEDEGEHGEAAPRGELAAHVVPPGGSRTWRFHLPRGAGNSLWLQFRFDYGSIERLPMQGDWSLRSSGASNVLWSAAVSNLPAGRHRIPVSLAAPASGSLALTFAGAPAPSASVIVFRQKAGALLLAGESGMVNHFARALFIVLLKLAVLAAAGLACSALFSTPVATFAATALAVMTLCVQYFISISGPGQQPHACGHSHGRDAGAPTAWYERAAESITRAAAVIVQPVDSLDGIEPVSDGLAVSWSLVGRSALILLGVYSLMLAAVGIIALRRRELADV